MRFSSMQKVARDDAQLRLRDLEGVLAQVRDRSLELDTFTLLGWNARLPWRSLRRRMMRASEITGS